MVEEEKEDNRVQEANSLIEDFYRGELRSRLSSDAGRMPGYRSRPIFTS